MQSLVRAVSGRQTVVQQNSIEPEQKYFETGI